MTSFIPAHTVIRSGRIARARGTCSLSTWPIRLPRMARLAYCRPGQSESTIAASRSANPSRLSTKLVYELGDQLEMAGEHRFRYDCAHDGPPGLPVSTTRRRMSVLLPEDRPFADANLFSITRQVCLST